MKTHCIGVLILAASLAAWLLAACADASAKKPPPLVLQGHSDVVTSVAFSPDGERALTGSADKMARKSAPSRGIPIL
jgi:WD40 repeat protein